MTFNCRKHCPQHHGVPFFLLLVSLPYFQNRSWHHPVCRKVKQLTSWGYFFDASPRESRLHLINVWYTGLQLTPLIFDVPIHFKTNIFLTLNIKKAFHQRSVNKKDRKFMRFLWFDVFSNQPNILRNRLARVIFCVTRLPFLHTWSI